MYQNSWMMAKSQKPSKPKCSVPSSEPPTNCIYLINFRLSSDVLAGHDPLDSTTIQDDFIPLDLSQSVDISRIRIGIPQEYSCPGMSHEVIETWSEVADILEQAGAEVVQVEKEHSHGRV
jgi:Asp-tRNA(Asn)/Glu-tRNA(Gln) amidotransferase A subunit family amidase